MLGLHTTLIFICFSLFYMPVTSFFTIERASAGSYKEKGSKFLAFAYPVQNEEDIKQCLLALRKEYFDARHHCYAWLLGADKDKFRTHDDGEPNHSAGDPILGQIRSKKLTNVVVIVVRYFGGTKLGVGGLIAAYKTAAEDALLNAIIIEKQLKKSIEFTFQYEATTEVMRLVKEFELSVVEQKFKENCLLRCEINTKDFSSFLGRAELLHQLNTSIGIKVNGEAI